MSGSIYQRLFEWLRSWVNDICIHDDVIKWKHFPRYWSFVRGIHRSPVNSRHKGQWRGALMFYLICAWTNRWVNNREAGDLRRHQAHYDVSVMIKTVAISSIPCDAYTLCLCIPIHVTWWGHLNIPNGIESHLNFLWYLLDLSWLIQYLSLISWTPRSYA